MSHEWLGRQLLSLLCFAPALHENSTDTVFSPCVSAVVNARVKEETGVSGKALWRRTGSPNLISRRGGCGVVEGARPWARKALGLERAGARLQERALQGKKWGQWLEGWCGPKTKVWNATSRSFILLHS